MKLPYPSLQSVTSVKYWDVNQAQQTLNADAYYWVVSSDDPGAVVQKYATVFPILQYGKPDAIEIEYIAGYGDDAASVPEEIKHAMKLLITDWYEHRGQVVIGLVSKIPNYVTDLLHPYKVYSF